MTSDPVFPRPFRAALAAAVLAAVALAGCGKGGNSKVLATVGSREITVEDFLWVARQPKIVERYSGLPDSVQIKLNEQDIKRANQIKSYPWFEHKKAWQKEIDKLLQNGFKLEVEALISKDISYVTEEYVPQRLEEGEFLD